MFIVSGRIKNRPIYAVYRKGTDMKLYIQSKKYGSNVVLKDVSIEFPEGSATLVIGASGGGKSTLMKSLVGLTKFKGYLLKDGNSRVRFNRKNICYISQQPLLNPKETVIQCLYYQTLLSFPNMSKTEALQYAKCFIQRFALSKVENQRIRSLSGGQQKRAAIAHGMLRNLPVIVADEIDSGLDCVLGESIIRDLCRIAHQEHKTLVVISHNLDNIRFFDNIVILAGDEHGTGRVVYSGPTKAVLKHFEAKDIKEVMHIVLW